MKFSWYFGVLFIIILVSVAAAQTSPSAVTGTAASQVMVTSVTSDPEVLMQGDEGLITLEVTNTGSESVPLAVAYLFSDGVTAMNGDAYLSLGTLGAGNRMTFTYTIEAKVKDGVYYPLFSLGFREPGSDSLRYPVPVKVESSELQLSVIAAPDTFSSGRSDAITLSIGNPRQNTVNGIVIIPSGEGIAFTQKSYFVGDLAPGEVRAVTFNATPTIATDLIFTGGYRNGMNDHNATLTLPLSFGNDKTRADPVVNNIQLSQSGLVYTLTGDVTNAGLSEARGVVVTVDVPAHPIDPNPISPLGSLAPDDLSSFEISFTASNLTEVPLVILYKDLDGNEFQKSASVSLDVEGQSSSSSTSGTVRNRGLFGFGGGTSAIPILPILIVIVAAIAIFVSWRKGIFRRKARK